MNPATERALIIALQAGVPLVERPFAALAAAHGVDEAAVIRLLETLLADGRGRRFGGIFDNAHLGARSALCAVDSGGDAAAVAAAITPFAGVTHCYERDGRPDLWFTLTALPADYAVTLAAITTGREVLELPTRRRFKLGVVLAPAQETAGEGVCDPAPGAARGPGAGTIDLGSVERRLVDRLQGGLPVTGQPFAPLGGDLGGEAGVLDRLHRWQAAGALRRVALVCRHQRLGYHGNVMAVWDLDDAVVVEAGRRLARETCISHCYERLRPPAFPFNLYAMIHRLTVAEAQATATRLGAAIGDPPGRVLTTLREFKKTSPRIFAGEAR